MKSNSSAVRPEAEVAGVVERLGPSVFIKPGEIYQLFLISTGKPVIKASHIGLKGGCIFAARRNIPGDFRSNEYHYNGISKGLMYVSFPEYYRKQSGEHHYGNPVWSEKMEADDLLRVSVLVKIKKSRPKAMLLYRSSHGRMKKGGNRKI